MFQIQESNYSCWNVVTKGWFETKPELQVQVINNYKRPLVSHF